ncbi:MAG: hypothetical protein AB1726_18185 [Planctomycetota bacterium]
MLIPALLSFLGGLPIAPADVTVRWRQEDHQASALPAELGAEARSAIETWQKWAAEQHYRLDLSADERVLLLSASGSSRRSQQAKLVAGALRFFDERLPAPAHRAGLAALAGGLAGEPAPPAGGDEPIPDDPEGDPPPLGPPRGVGAEGLEDPPEITWAWGAGSVPPDTETIVFLVLKKPNDYQSALVQLAKIAPYLEPWIAGARKYTGFVLEQPLAGAFVEAGEGREEWDPDAELVNRIAGLLLLRRFGRQPYWLTQGWAWVAELELRGGIYCFPYRSEFVWAVEHTGWPSTLRTKFASRTGDPLRLEEFAAWPRGTYQGDAALLSWGFADFLVAAHRAELPALLEALRVYRDAHDRIPLSATEWRRDPDYEIPLETLDELFRAHLGEDYLAAAARRFRGEE